MEPSLSTRPRKSVPVLRPSVLETRLRGEPWIGSCTHPGLLVMYVNNQPVTLLPGSTLEQASLNQLLFALQHRFPRRKNKR